MVADRKFLEIITDKGYIDSKKSYLFSQAIQLFDFVNHTLQ